LVGAGLGAPAGGGGDAVEEGVGRGLVGCVYSTVSNDSEILVKPTSSP
jgi:hypothetical protein